MVCDCYNTTKNCMDYMQKIIMLFIFVLTISSCQTLKSIGENPNYDMLDLVRGSKSFDLSAPFPKNGYKLRGITYRNIEIQKLAGNDTLYYIKYNPKREKRNFYFTVIDKQTADTILDNSLNKKKTPVVYHREQWLDQALIQLGIQNYTSNNSLWTYFKPEYKMVKGNLPTDIVRTGYHREYETFNYETAQKAYYMQRHPEEKYKGMQLLGALYIINMLSGKETNNSLERERKEREYQDRLYDEYLRQQRNR